MQLNGLQQPPLLRKVTTSGMRCKNMVKARLSQDAGAAKLHGGAEKVRVRHQTGPFYLWTRDQGLPGTPRSALLLQPCCYHQAASTNEVITGPASPFPWLHQPIPKCLHRTNRLHSCSLRFCFASGWIALDRSETLRIAPQRGPGWKGGEGRRRGRGNPEPQTYVGTKFT
jgi:hypothetical protein